MATYGESKKPGRRTSWHGWLGAALLILGVLPLGARSQEDRAARAGRFLTLSRSVSELFAKQDYAGAAVGCRELIRIAPRHPAPRYNLACALARQGEADDALAALGQAVERGYADAHHMRSDPDLAALRKDPRFAALAKSAAQADEDRRKALPYDKGLKIAGVKTVERNPAGGLRYRVRMSPDATGKDPNRLIIWLHPSGGSMNRTVEKLAHRLAEQGWALMVFTQKRFMSWTEDDARRLLLHTLPDAARIEGLSVEKPVLLGYSAGGQMALILWKDDPGAFGGLVLNAAYPVGARGANGRFSAMALPERDAVKDVPILAITGGKDGGTALWKKVQTEWEKAGIQLTLSIVPGKGHTWLLDKTRLRELEVWLRTVGAAPAEVTTSVDQVR